MKDPGLIKAGSKEHKAVLDFAIMLSERFEMALPAALGQVLKFDEAIRKVGQTETGMASLKITVDGQEI